MLSTFKQLDRIDDANRRAVAWQQCSCLSRLSVQSCAHREFASPSRGEFDHRGTTGVQDTHKTCIREVQYRWHPWYGKQVYIREEARRGGHVVLRCVRDELNRSAALEIPGWMFDSGYCSRMKEQDLAYVSVCALRALQVLLSREVDSIESSVDQAQHLSRDLGGADADEIPIQGPAGSTVCSTVTATGTSAGSLSADASLVGADDQRTPREGSLLVRTDGGGR